jgi:hypothetical protein
VTLTPPRERFFCSDAARSRGDDNAATASRTDVWILVELPGPWGKRPLLDGGLPLAVQANLLDAIEKIPRLRVVFIRRRFETRSGCRVYIGRSAPRPWVIFADLAAIEDVALLQFRDLTRGKAADGWTVSEKPVVLVCTHGQRDSCCGRRGFPLYDALRTAEPLDVWQCSHIGGDRFAANAVVLPWGLYYGPVEPRDAEALTESIVCGEILLDSYRGRSTVPRLGQAAETFVRRAAGIKGRDTLTITFRATLPDGRAHVHLRDDAGTLHEVTLEPYVSAEVALLTCTASSTCPVVQYRMVEYRATPSDASDPSSAFGTFSPLTRGEG